MSNKIRAIRVLKKDRNVILQDLSSIPKGLNIDLHQKIYKDTGILLYTGLKSKAFTIRKDEINNYDKEI